MKLFKSACTAIGLSFAVTGAASAGMVDLGGGWQAEWDASLDGLVDINPVQVIGDTIFIQKSAEFTQGPVNGIFPSIPITFTQTAESTINYIVIDDEIITNSTGSDWSDFHMDLLNDGDAWFDPTMTANSGGGGPIGFSIAPFTQAAFSNNDTRLDIWGGVVPNGSVWYPGDGATDGQLWIGVNSGLLGDFTSFILKETPTPAPGVLTLLAMAGLCGGRRRRS